MTLNNINNLNSVFILHLLKQMQCQTDLIDTLLYVSTLAIQ